MPLQTQNGKFIPNPGRKNPGASRLDLQALSERIAALESIVFARPGTVKTDELDSSDETENPENSEDKDSLIEKVPEIELVTQEDITQAISDASGDSDTADKETLIAKAIELKLAPQSSLARMSIAKLTALIATAQA
jgi:hypothetical protein